MSTNIDIGNTLHLQIESNGTGTLTDGANGTEVEQVQITCNSFTGTGEITVSVNNVQCGTISQSGQSVSVQKGSNVKLVATTAGNNIFVTWGNESIIQGVTNTIECTIHNIQDSITINPIFAESVYIKTNSFSNGVITISASKTFNNKDYIFETTINQNNTFPFYFYIPKGSDVTLVVAANGNSMFVTWGNNNIIQDEINKNKYIIYSIQNNTTINPIFAESICIETNSFSHGNITISAQKTIATNDYRFETTINQNDTFPSNFYIPKGSSVTLKANADTGYTFTEWGYNDQTDTSCNIGQLIAGIRITPVFEQTSQEYYSITINGLNFGYTIRVTDELGNIQHTFSKENNSYNFEKNSTIFFSPSQKPCYEFRGFSNNEIVGNGNGPYVLDTLDTNIETNVTFNVILRVIGLPPDNLWSVCLLDNGTITETFNNDNEEISFTINPSHNYVFQLNEPDNSNYYCIDNINGKPLTDILEALNDDNNVLELKFQYRVTDGEQKHYRFKLKYKGSNKSILIDWKPIVYNLNNATN